MSDDFKDVKIILAHGEDTLEPCVLSGILELCPSKSVVINEIRVRLIGQSFVSLANTERREDFVDIIQTVFQARSSQSASKSTQRFNKMSVTHYRSVFNL